MKKILSLFCTIFFTLLAISLVYFSQLDLEEGEKVGKGLFYLKGHYVEEEMMNGEKRMLEVYEQGPGIITVPLFISLLITGAYLLVRVGLRKKSRENLKDEKRLYKDYNS